MAEDGHSSTELSLWEVLGDNPPHLDKAPESLYMSQGERIMVRDDFRHRMANIGVYDPQSRVLNVKPESGEKKFAELHAIESEQVNIVALEGLDRSVLEYMGEEGTHRLAWQVEPYKDFSKIAISHNSFAGEMLNKSDIGKLWEIFIDTADIISSETGEDFDLENLTPYQTVEIIGEVIRRRIKYDNLILDRGEKTDSDSLQDLAGNTNRPDLVELLINNELKGKRAIRKWVRKVDGSPAERIVENGSGVCRHIAAVASTMYEAVKAKQKGLLMNGSYLIYTDEKRDLEKNWQSVGEHAYNLLIVTSPDKSQSETEKADVSVLDFTFGLDNSHNDYTWLRLSKAIGTIQTLGKYLGISNPIDQAETLADETIYRYSRGVEEMNNDSFLDFAPEYAALIALSSYQKGEKVVRRIADEFNIKGFTQSDSLLRTMNLSLITQEQQDGRRYIWGRYLKECAEEVGGITFTYPGNRDNGIKILSLLLNTVDSLNTKKWSTEGLIAIGCGDLALQTMRVAVETNQQVPKKTAKRITKLVNNLNRLDPGVLSPLIEHRFNELVR